MAQGKRFPDSSSLIKLYEVLDLNPVELLAGLEMVDKDLKRRLQARWIVEIKPSLFPAL